MDFDIKYAKSSMHCFALRLQPGDDMVQSLNNFVKQENLKSAFILTCVGSLKQAIVRLANADRNRKDEFISVNEPVEIVSLVGTLSLSGMHLHVSLADGKGKVIGGHLMANNSVVHTTVEIVIGSCAEINFGREFDPKTGYKELAVSNNV